MHRRDQLPMLEEVLTHQPWVDFAACRGLAYEERSFSTFFPDTIASNARQEAKRLCSTCPVRISCLDFALRNSIKDGVWGGFDEAERRRMRLRYKRRLKKMAEAVDSVVVSVMDDLDDESKVL